MRFTENNKCNGLLYHSKDESKSLKRDWVEQIIKDYSRRTLAIEPYGIEDFRYDFTLTETLTS